MTAPAINGKRHQPVAHLLVAHVLLMHICCLRNPLPPSIPAVYGGYFRNQVHCTSCGYDSNSYDAFMDLSLEGMYQI